MEIPGIAPFSGQPTLTNPLSPQEQLVGRESQAQSGNETQNTVTVSEQESTTIRNTKVVEQTNETDATNVNPNNHNGSINLTA